MMDLTAEQDTEEDRQIMIGVLKDRWEKYPDPRMSFDDIHLEFNRIKTDKILKRLQKAGLAQFRHGLFEITDAGRKALDGGEE